MHVILGLLGALVTIMFLLDRLGIDIGGLNPFYWYRRRAFAQKYGSDPIYSVEDPIHVAALLVVGAAKLDGDLTANQKAVAQGLFESEFSIETKEASTLFGSAAHLLAAPQLIENQLSKLAEANENLFSTSQAESLVEMMRTVVAADGDAAANQTAFIESVEATFVQGRRKEGAWS